ncbi:C32 tRNA thiolase [Escherichia coli]|nr:C32 tRNA thiolase [Escherichia coli]
MSQNQEISKKEQYNLNKLQKRLRRNVAKPLLTSI